jgi:hypothetical protein
MLTQEQAQALIADGATQVLRKCGSGLVEKSTLLECLLFINTTINDAMHNGDLDDITITSVQREILTQRAAGIMLLALQQHGTSLYTTHQLQRSLHSTQAPQKALLLETQFVTSELREAYYTCYEAALNNEPFKSDDWGKLRLSLQKLGAKL